MRVSEITQFFKSRTLYFSYAQYANPHPSADSRLSSATVDDTNDEEPVAAFRHVYRKPYDPFPNDNHRFPENHPSQAYKNNRPTNYLPNYYNYVSRNPTKYNYGSYYYPTGLGPYPNTNPYHWYGGYAPGHGYNSGGYGHYGNGYGYGYGSPDGTPYNTGSYPHSHYKHVGFGNDAAGAEKDAALHSNLYEKV